MMSGHGSFSRLLLSPRAERAIAEATLDWRHELDMASSISRQWGCHVRFTLGLIRIAGLTAFADVRGALRIEWLVPLIFWMAAIGWWAFAPTLPRPSQTIEVFHADRMMHVLFALATAFQLAPVLTLATGRRSRPAPVLGLVVMTVFANIAMGRVLLPWAARPLLNAAGWSMSDPTWPWWLIVAMSLLATELILIAECLRTEHRRLMATAVVVALPLFSVFNLYKGRIAVWLNDIGMLGDTVYLPTVPLPDLRFLTPWLTVAIAMPFLAWLLWRRGARRDDGARPHGANA
jgi:hypothetical protein